MNIRKFFWFCTVAFTVLGLRAVDVYVANGGVDEPGRGSEEQPFASVSYAVNSLVPDGGTVYVADGTYTETAPYCSIIITNAISVIGRSGNPSNVVITTSRNTKANTAARIFAINHPDALVKYVTIYHGTRYNVPQTGDWIQTMNAHGANVFIGALGGTVEDCIIKGGRIGKGSGSYVAGYATGANCYMAAGRIARCDISDGQVVDGNVGAGGSEYIAGGVMENCIIHDEIALEVRGVVNLYGGTLVNCTIANNTGSTTSGVYLNGANGRVVNCIISGNTLTGSASETNTVYYLSRDSKGKYTSSLSQFVNCLADDILINETCYTGAPAFKKETASDYRINGSSAALDRGLNYSDTVATSTTDFYGNPREVGQVDIGACENQKDEVDIDIVTSTDYYLNGHEITFTATVTGASGDLTYDWDFDGDGNVDMSTDVGTASHTYSAAGDYEMKLTVTASAKNATKELAIHISPVVLYVNASSENPAEPYDTPQTAATSVKPAVDYANDGAKIMIAPGTYGRGTELEVTKGISLVGAGEGVVFRNTGGGGFGVLCRVLHLNHPDAQAVNLTLADGNTDAVTGAGVCVGSLGGTVSNCVIRNCRNRNISSHGAGAHMAAGLITHCVITNCYSSSPNSRPDGFASGIYLENSAKASNCLVTECRSQMYNGLDCVVHATGSSTVENCTIVNCDVKDTKYALDLSSSATIRNCVIAGMTTTNGTPASVCSNATAARFFNCASDTEEPINETCKCAAAASLFMNYASADYTPANRSVLRNNGAEPSVVTSVDLSGNPRVYGRAIDIGAYENQFMPGMTILYR